ncbi:MAG: hypothetical protein ACKVZ0_17730 [Gemmatimonadales bacterium]
MPAESADFTQTLGEAAQRLVGDLSGGDRLRHLPAADGQPTVDAGTIGREAGRRTGANGEPLPAIGQLFVAGPIGLKGSGSASGVTAGQSPEAGVPIDGPLTLPTLPRKPPAASLPPLGVFWPRLPLLATGATGPGIDGTAEGAARQLALKVGYYLDPVGHGVQLNTEARLFRDAVAKGYVTADPDGLATLLSHLSRGAIGPEARSPEMTEYFRQFFEAERARESPRAT